MTYLTTAEVLDRLRIRRDALAGLMRDTTAAEIEPAWLLYAGVHGQRSAR